MIESAPTLREKKRAYRHDHIENWRRSGLSQRNIVNKPISNFIIFVGGLQEV